MIFHDNVSYALLLDICSASYALLGSSHNISYAWLSIVPGVSNVMYHYSLFIMIIIHYS